jgi:hypothetical protein
MEDEREFFSDKGVRVTQTRFVVNDQTYAMTGITSIRREIVKPSRLWPIVVIVLGMGLALMADVFGLFIAGAGAFFLWKRKPDYTVMLQTASGESQALRSQDGPWINGIVSAVNEAIVARG